MTFEDYDKATQMKSQFNSVASIHKCIDLYTKRTNCQFRLVGRYFCRFVQALITRWLGLYCISLTSHIKARTERTYWTELDWIKL